MSPGNLINHAAGWLEGGLTASFEKTIIDSEMLRGWARSLRPIEATEADLGTDAVLDVPPAGHFFGSPHTIGRFETAFYRPLVSDWRNFESWQEDGAKSATERANALLPAILKTYQPPPLDPAVDEALLDYMARRERDLAA